MNPVETDHLQMQLTEQLAKRIGELFEQGWTADRIVPAMVGIAKAIAGLEDKPSKFASIFQDAGRQILDGRLEAEIRGLSAVKH